MSIDNSKPTGKAMVSMVNLPNRDHVISLCQRLGMYDTAPARNSEVAALLRDRDLEGIYSYRGDGRTCRAHRRKEAVQPEPEQPKGQSLMLAPPIITEPAVARPRRMRRSPHVEPATP